MAKSYFLKGLYVLDIFCSPIVIKNSPAIELSTNADDDGVVFARCNVTHDVLKVVDGELWSEELRKRIPRKISKIYGKVQV